MGDNFPSEKVKISVEISAILSEMLSSISRNLLRRSCYSIEQCRNLSVTSIKYVRSPRSISSNTNSAFGTYPNQQEIEVDTTPQERLETKEIRSKVNEQITNKSYGRLFAIIAFDNHQYKLTEGDLLMVLLNIGAKNGQKIRLDKICLIGSKDFTLLGRPLLPRDLVNVEATVVEKSLSHKKIVQMLRSNSPNRKITGRRPIRWQEFYREYTTTLRINKIELLIPVDETIDR